MNIRQIEYVLVLSEERSFSKAAARCYISQSTLSTMVARFEDELNIRVFDRSTKPLSLTREGRQVVEQLKLISRELDHLGELARNLRGEVGGSFRMAVIPTVSSYLLPLFLSKFTARFPDVAFTVSDMTTVQIRESIERRELDVGIVSISLRHPGLIEYPLYEEPFVLYDHRKREEATCDINKLDTGRLWLLEEGHCLRTQVERICHMEGSRKRGEGNLEYLSGSMDTLMKFVRRNEGMTLLPYLAALELPQSEESHIYPFGEPVPGRAIGLVVHRHFVKKQLLEALMKMIREEVDPLLTRTAGNLQTIDPV